MSHKKPWHHGAYDEGRSRESAGAYQAFEVYLHQIAERGRRSYREVARTLGKSGTTIDRFASRWHWSERVTAYDQERAVRRLEVVERKQDIGVAAWIDRFAEIDERSFADGLELMEFGADIRRQLRELPVVERVEVSKDKTVVVQPINPALAARAAELTRTGTDLCRQACLAAIFRNGLPKDLGVQRVLPSGNDKPQLPDSRHVNGAVDWGERPEKPDSGRATRSGSSERR